ncbi:hypothetical protein WMY93_015718 [Mugilogobius chulae]|uniref:Trichohyalin-plectin-homology domain-containing protein n=1 Tax=Mugilogobius chulae TaxID=88201 RepID=A0AAW0NVN5_9GOBI
MEKLYEKAGYKPSEISALRMKVHESMRSKQEEDKKRVEHLDLLVAQREGRLKEEKQKVLEASNFKTLEETHDYAELKSAVLLSKIDQENRALLRLKREREEKEKAARESRCEYLGGMLPCHKEVARAAQEREEKKRQLLESVNSFNKKSAEQKVIEKKQKPSALPHYDQEDEHASKLRSQAALHDIFTECVLLKHKRLEKEKKEMAEREAQWRNAQADMESKYQLRRLQALERLQQKQQGKEMAGFKLDIFKKEQEVKVRKEEAHREEFLRIKQQQLLKNEQEKLAKKTASNREIATYWRKQVQTKEERKREELKFHQELRDKERPLLDPKQRNVEQSRRVLMQYEQHNSSMIALRNAVEKQRKTREREEEEREVERQREKYTQFQECMEKEIEKAEADQRIVTPLLNLRRKQEARDKLICFYKDNKMLVVPRLCSGKSRQMISDEDCDRETLTSDQTEKNQDTDTWVDSGEVSCEEVTFESDKMLNGSIEISPPSEITKKDDTQLRKCVLKKTSMHDNSFDSITRQSASNNAQQLAKIPALLMKPQESANRTKMLPYVIQEKQPLTDPKPAATVNLVFADQVSNQDNKSKNAKMPPIQSLKNTTAPSRNFSSGFARNGSTSHRNFVSPSLRQSGLIPITQSQHSTNDIPVQVLPLQPVPRQHKKI